MESLVKTITNNKSQNLEEIDDIEEGKNVSLLDQIQRYRAQDKFSTCQIEESKDETITLFTDIQDEDLPVQVHSDAWPEQDQIPIKSKVHTIIRSQLSDIDKSKIYYRQLDGKDLEEVKNLHQEWFPLDYQDTFYRRIYKNNVIAIGAFYPTYQDYVSRDKSVKKKKKKEILLGTMMTKVDRDNEDINEIYRAKQIRQGGIAAWFNFLVCRQYVGAYIMTIGVVDECRRDGLGTQMLNHTINILQQVWPQCEIIYLHVVDYNETAIRFYERNSFRTLKRLKKHYMIKNKHYDALLLYKDLNLTIIQENSNNNQQTVNRTNNNHTWSMYDYARFPIEYLRAYFNH